MSKKYFYLMIIISCGVLWSCTHRESTVNLWNESIPVHGSPDLNLINQLEHGDVDFVFSFSNMMHLSIIIEPPFVYHCFILEQIDNKKQLNYLKLDDAANFNFIPEYDSLNYDLNYCIEYVEKGLLPSTKLDSVPLLRSKSKKYKRLLLLCDDDKDLTDYYNNSIYFNSDSTVIDKYMKKTRLFELIEVLLIRINLSGVYADFPYLYRLFLSNDISSAHIEENFYPNIYYEFDKKITNYNPANLLEEHLPQWYKWYNLGSYVSSLDGKRYDTKKYSYYKCLKDNLKTKINEIDSLYKAGWYIYNYRYCYYFAFNITFDLNKIKIEKKFINSNYLLSSRIGME